MPQLFAIALLSCVKLIACMLGAPGVPIPGAEIISQVFAKHLKIEGSFINYLKNTKSNDTEGGENINENLDISVMDLNNFRRLINIGKKKTEKNFRRQNYFKRHVTKTNRLQTAGFKYHQRENPDAYARDWGNVGGWLGNLIFNDRQVEKLFHMMKQSIYVVRDRIERTKKMRDYYAENPSYKIALLDSAIHHNMRKLDFFLARMKRRAFLTHYLWYLVMYEKVLQCNVDINYAVERIFIINRRYNEILALMPNMPKGLAADPDAYKHMINDLSAETQSKMGNG